MADREWMKRPVAMSRERMLIPPDPDDTFERVWRDVTLPLDRLPTEYPALADRGADALCQAGRRALAKEAAPIDRARECFRAVVERYPAYWPAVNNLGVVTEPRGAGSLAAAAACYQEVIRGSLAMLAGELSRAAAPTVIPVASEHLVLSLAAAYFNLGALLRARGNSEATLAYHESALTALRRSLAVLDPGQARQQQSRYLVMAACFYEFGRREEASQALRKAYELDRDHWHHQRENDCRPFPLLRSLIATAGDERETEGG